MSSRLYGDLVAFYPLLDPVEEHEEEAIAYGGAIAAALDANGPSSEKPSLLEIGSGAGNNAVFLKQSFTMTLSDLAPAMLDLSRAQHPSTVHVEGDMRTMRLNKTFDAVFIHDAICYMTTIDELGQAIETAFVHTRPGGVAAFAPDVFREDFRDSTDTYERHADGRMLMGMELMWDPDPNDQTFAVDYAFLLREAAGVTALHERHVEGMFTRQQWRDALTAAGFIVDTAIRPLGLDVDDGEEAAAEHGYAEDFFVCTRP